MPGSVSAEPSDTHTGVRATRTRMRPLLILCLRTHVARLPGLDQLCLSGG